MKWLKILYIYKYAILGGVTTQLVNRIQEIHKQVECHVLYIQDHGGTKAYIGNKAHIIVEKDTTRIASYIDKHKFDIVIVIDTLEGYQALEKCQHQPKVVSEVHTTTSNLEQLQELSKTMPMDAFITPSEYLKHRILKNYGFENKKKCYVVENCLDTTLFHDKYSVIEYDKPIIGWVGKLDDHKNWKKMLRISKCLIQKLPQLEIWVIGGYTAPDFVVDNFLEEMKLLGLMNHIKWFSYVPYAIMPKIYNKIARSGGCTLSTSKNESFGMTAVEAMACKCPLVMPKVGALPEVLDGQLGKYLYDYEDEIQAVTLVENIVKKNSQIDIEIGYDKVRNIYSIERIGKKYIDTLYAVMQL